MSSVVAINVKGTSSVKDGLKYFPYSINTHGVFLPGDGTFQDSRLERLIKERLDIFQAQLGYPHDIQAEHIYDIIKQSAELFSILRFMRRGYNVKNVRDVYSHKMGTAFSKWYPRNNIGDIVWDGSSEPTAGVTLPGMSNTDWEALIGQSLGLIKAPLAWLNMLDYFMSNFYSLHHETDDGHTSFIGFQPMSSITQTSAFMTTIQDLMYNINFYYDARPLIVTFMEEHLGIGDYAKLFSWDRDLAGLTIQIVEDTNLIYALETTPTVYFQYFNLDQLENREYIYTPGEIYNTPFNAIESIDIPNDMLVEKFLTFAKVDTGVLNHISATNVGVNIQDDSMFYTLPTGAIVAGYEHLSAEGLQQFMIGQKNFPLDLPFNPVYIIGSSETIAENDSAIGFIPGYNLYSISEDDFMVIRNNTTLEWFFGNTNFQFTYPGPINRTGGISTLDGKAKSINVNAEPYTKRKQSNTNNNRNTKSKEKRS